MLDHTLRFCRNVRPTAESVEDSEEDADDERVPSFDALCPSPNDEDELNNLVAEFMTKSNDSVGGVQKEKGS